MAFSPAEVANIANAALDFYLDKGNVFSQTIQARPLFNAMDKAAKTFPGGKGEVSLAVKGTYTTAVAGYTHNDTVTYANPANIKRAEYPWFEHHAGISVTHTELKHDGISVVDGGGGESTSGHSGREATMLANLLEDKLEDMAEGYARGMNSLLYGDGVAAGNVLQGIQHILPDVPPETGTTVGGLSTVDNTWWRNRADVGLTPSTLLEFIHTEIRQLRRYGGNPKIAVCGSDFLDQLVSLITAKGNYTQTGFAGRGATDIEVADVHYGGITFKYDPTLDDLTISGQDPKKRCYIIDPSKLYLSYMADEKMNRHSPSRPHDSYVMYRAITTTCTLCASQLNCHGTYEIS